MPTITEFSPIHACLDCILFHCNGDLPERESHAAAIVQGFEEVQVDGWQVSADDLDDDVDHYGERCGICGARGATSPRALVLLREQLRRR